MELGLATILNFFSAAIVASLTTVVYLGSKKPESRAFAFTTFWVAVWGLSHAVFHGLVDENMAYLFTRIDFFLGSVIAVSFFYFSSVFYYKKHRPIFTVIPLVGIIFVFSILFFDPDINNLIISGVEPHAGLQGWSWTKGPMWYFFDVIFIGFWIAGMTMLYLKYKHSEETERSQNFYMFIAMLIAIIPTSLLNIILPDFGYFELDWMGTLTSVPWVSVLAYSIIKHNQMNIRVVLTEVLVLAAILILFINIFV